MIKLKTKQLLKVTSPTYICTPLGFYAYPLHYDNEDKHTPDDTTVVAFYRSLSCNWLIQNLYLQKKTSWIVWNNSAFQNEEDFILQPQRAKEKTVLLTAISLK